MNSLMSFATGATSSLNSRSLVISLVYSSPEQSVELLVEVVELIHVGKIHMDDSFGWNLGNNLYSCMNLCMQTHTHNMHTTVSQ